MTGGWELAIRQTNAGLAILDPFQAYLGGVDMHRANEVRPVFKRLGQAVEAPTVSSSSSGA